MNMKLTDMQLVLLATACQRDDGSLLPPPASLGTQAARIRRAVTGLIKQALVSECDIAEQAGTWREEKDRHIGVVITDAGRAVIAAEEQEGPANPKAVANSNAEAVCDSKAGTTDAAEPEPAPSDLAPSEAAAPPRTGTKQGLVLEMLRRTGGVTLAELVAATGWLPHTTRAALTGLRKKGHSIEKATRDGATAYMIAVA